MSRLGYMASHYDSALFLCCTDKGTILFLLHVDDMIITGDDLIGIQELKDFLKIGRASCRERVFALV